jgi:RimJ/RimL family protein N-acetyltransferase
MNGRGIVTSALKSIIRIGFDMYSLDKIFLNCGTTNEKSRKVAEGCGFEFLYEIKEFENLRGTIIDFFILL